MTLNYLYHGTAVSRLPGIAQHGLVPRTGPSVWPEAPSVKGRVYLTSTYPVHFAQAAAQHWKEPEKMLLLRIDMTKLDKSKLVADEDVVSQLTASRQGLTLREMHDMLLEDPEAYENLITWEESLLVLGTVAYKGAVPPEAIDKVVVLTDLTFGDRLRMSDAIISVLARRIMGKSYEADIGWLFGGAKADRPVPEYLQEHMQSNEAYYRHWTQFSETLRGKTAVYDSLDEAMQTFARAPTDAKEGDDR